jgi:NAD(P)-dependent dehydrogenase (short-subunit alcohol dehydrogenase family)
MIKPSFKNKIVVVTGAASGIGASISRKFAQHGATIGMLDQDEKGVRAAAAELGAAGMNAIGLPCDVSQEEQCASAIREIIDCYGGIDVLINNAGITQRSGFVETRLSVYRKVMEINFFGSLHCTKSAIESLIARRGMIIIIESIAGFAPLLGRTAYCASKHALHGLFTSLRSEMRANGVHVMIVCPGFVKTNLQSRALGGDGRVTAHPQSRVGKQDSPDRIAEAVYRGGLKQKKMLILSPIGKLTYWISRLTPVLYERIMTRQLKEELIRNGFNTSSNE